MESCEERLPEILSIDDFITTGKTDKTWCFGYLQALDKACAGFPRRRESGDIRRYCNPQYRWVRRQSYHRSCYNGQGPRSREEFDDAEELIVFLPDPEPTEKVDMESSDRRPGTLLKQRNRLCL